MPLKARGSDHHRSHSQAYARHRGIGATLFLSRRASMPPDNPQVYVAVGPGFAPGARTEGCHFLRMAGLKQRPHHLSEDGVALAHLSAGAVRSDRRASVLAHGHTLPRVRGKGMVSRMCCRPQIQATQRSTPMPKPEWGTEP